jgi:Xaa-Pro aminopeptidase
LSNDPFSMLAPKCDGHLQTYIEFNIITIIHTQLYFFINRLNDDLSLCDLETSSMSQVLVSVREAMVAAGVSAIWVGSGDAHQSEYVASSEERRSYLSGFTGSAGTAVVTMDQALLWTDGRYFLQGEQQLSEEWKLMRSGNKGVPEINTWLANTLSSGDKVGVDARLLSASEANGMIKKLAKKQITLVGLDSNPIDYAWGSDQPARPSTSVRPHPMHLAGKSHVDKIADVVTAIKAEGSVGCVFSMLDEICWLLNLRGNDVQFNPVFYAFCVVTLDKVHLFINPVQVTEDSKSHLGTHVVLHPYEDTKSFVENLSKSGRVMADPSQLNWEIYQALGDSVISMKSPVTLPKSIKNETELNGIRAAHLRDGAALTAFLHWLEVTVTARKETVTEYTAAEKLEEFRGKMPMHISPSFATIAGYGSNGAIIHYKPEQDTAAVIGTESLFLLDSGAQYADGTTDVTRTLHFGEATERMKECYTRVLQGHIGLATSIFPELTLGSRLDAIARLPLWEAGLDYNHGTGHGVGAHLNVHEGPQGIGFRKRENEEGFRAGMTISNEPGYYEDGAFGIRIETVCITIPVDTPNRFGNRDFCGFETVTMTPINTKLVVNELLSQKERKWLNDYNAEVRSKLLPIMKEYFPGDAVAYLQRETEPIA